MKKLGTYHYDFSETGTHTFQLNATTECDILIKNLTPGNISVSYGTEIDTTNDDYIYMLPNTAELVSYKSGNSNDNILITVNAEETGVVELRILN